jgi:DNA-binding Lrp family transcriptional regulator
VAVKAYVLVVTDPGQTKRVFDALRAVQGVVEVHEVMGPYDIIVEIDVPNLVDVPPILSTHIRAIPGIQSTTSLVSFPDAASS